MAFCGKCGTKVDDNVKFCPGCGEALAAPQQAPSEIPAADAAPAQNSGNDFTAKVAALNNTADTTSEFDPTDIEQNKGMAVLGYLSWLVLIPIFATKSKYARFHANQGLVLAIAEIAWWIVTAILNAILYAISWRLGAIVSTVLGLVNFAFVILAILGIVNAVNGKAKELPIVGKFRLLK